MHEDTWLRITDMARRLGRPPATVAYWRNVHRPHLAARTDASGHTTYALSQFEGIAAMVSRGASRNEVARVLRGEPAQREPRLRPFEAELLEEMRKIRTLLEQIARRQATREDGR